jgi:hypothetical protein
MLAGRRSQPPRAKQKGANSMNRIWMVFTSYDDGKHYRPTGCYYNHENAIEYVEEKEKQDPDKKFLIENFPIWDA